MKNLEFENIWQNREIVKVKDIPINLISLDDLISSKEIAGRNVKNEKRRVLVPYSLIRPPRVFLIAEQAKVSFLTRDE